jgi:ATP-dependent Clp endopeptidase proteolytic subunit ClpP
MKNERIILNVASTPKLGEDNDKLLFETVDNTIYFYSEVDRESILKLNKTLRELDTLIIKNKISKRSEVLDSIYLHINSYGGEVFSCFSAVDNMINTKSPIVTVVDGVAASAATIISVTGKRRLMFKHSSMLIHQMSSGYWGTWEEQKDNMKNNERLMNMIYNHYLEYTKIPKEKLEEILKHDLWFDAKTCLEYGLIDEII